MTKSILPNLFIHSTSKILDLILVSVNKQDVIFLLGVFHYHGIRPWAGGEGTLSALPSEETITESR